MATYAFGRLPIGTLAYRPMNLLLGRCCGALTCMCIFLTGRRLGVTRLLSVAAALTAATSYPVWSNSVTAEVYTLAAVLSGLRRLLADRVRADRRGLAALRRLRDVGVRVRQSPDDRRHPAGGGHLRPGVKDRSVLRPRVALTAAFIGILGVLQYGFIALRTIQGAPYLEARATTIQGVFDVIIARDVSWARFYQAQSAVAAIEVPMLLNGLRVHMGMIALAGPSRSPSSWASSGATRRRR